MRRRHAFALFAIKAVNDFFDLLNWLSPLITGLATGVIALFTIFLYNASVDQNRARIVVGNDRAEMLKLVDTGSGTKLAIYLTNDGHSAAREVVPEV